MFFANFYDSNGETIPEMVLYRQPNGELSGAQCSSGAKRRHCQTSPWGKGAFALLSCGGRGTNWLCICVQTGAESGRPVSGCLTWKGVQDSAAATANIPTPLLGLILLSLYLVPLPTFPIPKTLLLALCQPSLLPWRHEHALQPAAQMCCQKKAFVRAGLAYLSNTKH